MQDDDWLYHRVFFNIRPQVLIGKYQHCGCHFLNSASDTYLTLHKRHIMHMEDCSAEELYVCFSWI